MDIAIIKFGPNKAYQRKVIALAFLALAMQVVVFSFQEWNLITLAYIVILPIVAFGIFYRKFVPMGTVRLNVDSIGVSSDNKNYSFNLEAVRELRLDYTNPWKGLGLYCWQSPNYLTIVSAEGLENKCQILIDGKQCKKELKNVLQKYKDSGVEVTIKSNVAASWLEF